MLPDSLLPIPHYHAGMGNDRSPMSLEEASRLPASPALANGHTPGAAGSWPSLPVSWHDLWQQIVRLPGWLQGALIASLFAAAHPFILDFTHFYWYLPAGVRFTLLLFLPRRLWPAVIFGEWTSRWLAAAVWGSPTYHLMVSALPQPVSSLVAVMWLRRKGPLPSPATPRGMLQLLAAMLLSAGLEALANLFYVWYSVVFVDFYSSNLTLPMFTVTVFLGDLMGPLVIAPAVLAVTRFRMPRTLGPRLAFDIILALALPMLGFVLLYDSHFADLARSYLQVLVVLPTVFLAFRYGWRGAAAALTILSTTVAFFHTQRLMGVPGSIVVVQMLLAVMGSGALIFGAAIDTLRRHQKALASRNLELQAANINLGDMAGELRQAARRNMRVGENQRRRFAGALHDELGQSLTALQTRLKLAVPSTDDAHGMEAIIDDMRRTIHRMMDSLRPAVLDEFGLLRALQDGPVSELLQDAGVDYSFRLDGEPALLDALDDETAVAAWRMVQEAATNAVKHARATAFLVRMRIGLRGDNVWLLLDIRDNGVGLAATEDDTRRGHGLQGMRDRMLALDGVFRVDDANPGTRLRVLLRQPLPE